MLRVNRYLLLYLGSLSSVRIFLWWQSKRLIAKESSKLGTHHELSIDPKNIHELHDGEQFGLVGKSSLKCICASICLHLYTKELHYDMNFLHVQNA